MDDSARLMGVEEYARHRGVTRKAVQRAIESGRIPFTVNPDNQKRQIDPEVADIAWAQNTDIGKLPHAVLAKHIPEVMGDGPSNPADLMAELFKAKAAHERYKSELARLKLERETGKLVPITEIQAAVENEYTYVRAKLVALPSKLARKLATMSEIAEVKVVLEDAIAEVLAELTLDVDGEHE